MKKARQKKSSSLDQSGISGDILQWPPGYIWLSSFYNYRRDFKNHQGRWVTHLSRSTIPIPLDPHPQRRRAPQTPITPGALEFLLECPRSAHAGHSSQVGTGGNEWVRKRGLFTGYACMPALPKSQKETNNKFNDDGRERGRGGYGSLKMRIMIQ